MWFKNNDEVDPEKIVKDAAKDLEEMGTKAYKKGRNDLIT